MITFIIIMLAILVILSVASLDNAASNAVGLTLLTVAAGGVLAIVFAAQLY